MRLNKVRVISVIVAIILLIAAISAILYNSFKNARLTVIVTPIDSEITVNSKKYNNGTANFFPGEVEIKVTHDSLDEKIITLNLEPNKTTTAYIYLSDNGNFDYYETYSVDYEILKLVADENAKEYLDKTEKKLSIKQLLPFSRMIKSDTPNSKNGSFSRETIINDGTEDDDCDRIICLTLIDNTDSDDTARVLMKEYGYNFDDYKILRK